MSALETAMGYARDGMLIPDHVLAELSPDEQEQCTRVAKHHAWLRWAPSIGVPPRLRGVGWNDRETNSLQAVREYMRDRYPTGGALTLAGPTGVGKSWSAALALRVAGPGHWRFWYFPALCGAWLDPERRQAALTQSQEAPMAVFDDVGVEYSKDGGLVEAFLDELIWHREAWCLPTIITTNLTIDAMRERLPARLVDRLRGEWGRIVEAPGASLR